MKGLSQSTMIYISKKERNSSVTPVTLTTRVCTESRIILEPQFVALVRKKEFRRESTRAFIGRRILNTFAAHARVDTKVFQEYTLI